MNKEYRALVDAENSPAAVMDVIAKHFKLAMPTRRELFDTELRNFKWQGKCVDRNSERYQAMLRKFMGNGGSKTDHQYAMDFIRQAPEPYSTVIGQYQALENVTLLKVTEGLRRIQLQKAISEETSSDGKRSQSHALNVDQGKGNMSCFFCKKKGHMKKDCSKFAEWKKKKGYTSNHKEEHAGIVLHATVHEDENKGSMKHGKLAIMTRNPTLETASNLWVSETEIEPNTKCWADEKKPHSNLKVTCGLVELKVK